MDFIRNTGVKQKTKIRNDFLFVLRVPFRQTAGVLLTGLMSDRDKESGNLSFTDQGSLPVTIQTGFN